MFVIIENSHFLVVVLYSSYSINDADFGLIFYSDSLILHSFSLLLKILIFKIFKSWQ